MPDSSCVCALIMAKTFNVEAFPQLFQKTCAATQDYLNALFHKTTGRSRRLSTYEPDLLLLLLISAFPFNQVWPQRITILHIFLSSTSVSFAPTSPISSFTTSKNLFFGLPLFLFPGNSVSMIFLPTYSWSLLMTCPEYFLIYKLDL